MDVFVLASATAQKGSGLSWPWIRMCSGERFNIASRAAVGIFKAPETLRQASL